MHPQLPPLSSASVPALPPPRRLDAQALQDFAALLPPSALALRRHLGDEVALLLLNRLPGAQLPIPKHPDANAHGARRWARYAELLGEPAMQALAAHWGGTLLDVPVCAQLLDAVRDRWLRARFDALTRVHPPGGPALSSYAALGELCEALASAGQPLTFRHVQVIVNRSDELPDGQVDLFGG
ncbi:MAG: hypothetical protein RLY71_457 [Pseudomonadota bacterium]|jgi:hypothetical protein